MPLPTVSQSSQTWASVANMWTAAFNSGWIPDQLIGSTGAFTAAVTPSSSSFQFYSTGDATAFYLPGRSIKAVQGVNTLYCQTVSSSCSGTSTIVTVKNFVNSSGFSTGAFTSIAVAPTFESTGGGAGNAPDHFGTMLILRSWGF